MKNLSIPSAIIIAGVIIAGAIFFSGDPKTPTNTINTDIPNQETGLTNLIPVSEKDHLIGNPNAEITIVEYSDTECPYCKRFHSTMQEVMNQYGKEGNVNWVYRHFPLDSLHRKARVEAEATECVAELGGNEKFWQYLDKIYETTTSNDGFDLAQLPIIAEEFGVDKNEFEKCLSENRHEQKVEESLQGGINAGIEGTPFSIIIKGDKKIAVGGAFPYTTTNLSFYSSLSASEKVDFCNENKECGLKNAIENLLK